LERIAQLKEIVDNAWEGEEDRDDGDKADRISIELRDAIGAIHGSSVSG
jgi:hypothetical protein